MCLRTHPLKLQAYNRETRLSRRWARCYTWRLVELTVIRGPEDSEVTIGIKRENLPYATEYVIVRKPIQISNIELSDMGDGIAYIRILRFGDLKTFFDFVDIYTGLPAEGFTSVILDVRSNPGGSLDVLLNILNYVVPDKGKELMSIYTRDTGHDIYLSDGLGWTPKKMLILVNEHTASAAEVFAGSLQVLDYAEDWKAHLWKRILAVSLTMDGAVPFSKL